ncbi:hypothetical protein DYB26_004377 [Aphanomyces astaci]|uniref:Protein kinase domain-containing protein n=1 Tax=Aphanomyces astaci TaxID=112090 RepID=A0A3R7BVQ3_APHAT|nr:hypothetical protein DYB26_004377 [Aphanomyces astaci]
MKPQKESVQTLPPSTTTTNNNQRHHPLPRCKFQTVEHQVIPLTAIIQALATIVAKPANRPERDEICFSMLDEDNVHTTTLDGYVLGKVVGVGTFGKVRVATHKVSSQVVAIKSYERSRTKDAAQWKRIQYEAKLMEKLDHPYIIRLFETIETSTKLHIVMENVSSDVGNLCEFVKRQKRLAEDDAGLLFMQVVSAVMYMHSMQLVHRDIKLENILLDRYGNTKLVDFGFSAVQSTSKPFSTFCGTPCYMAPEIIHRKTYWGQPVDVWSLGVLLFAMLCGYFPFRARNYNDLYRKIVKGGFDIPGFVTPDAQALLRGMLEGDPTKLLDHMEVLGLPRSMVVTALTGKLYNGLSTLYYLLLYRAESMCRELNSPTTATTLPSSTTTSPTAESPRASFPSTTASEALPVHIQPEGSITLDSLAQLSGPPPPPPEEDLHSEENDPIALWQSRELRDVVEILDKGM